MSAFLGLLRGRPSSGSGRDKKLRLERFVRAAPGAYRIDVASGRSCILAGPGTPPRPRDPPGPSPEAHSGGRKAAARWIGRARKSSARDKGVKYYVCTLRADTRHATSIGSGHSKTSGGLADEVECNLTSPNVAVGASSRVVRGPRGGGRACCCWRLGCSSPAGAEAVHAMQETQHAHRAAAP